MLVWLAALAQLNSGAIDANSTSVARFQKVLLYGSSLAHGKRNKYGNKNVTKVFK